MNRKLVAAAIGAVCWAGGSGALADGGTHFLTIGGGYSPSGNQVSLEKNVQFYRRMLADLGLGSCPHHLLFADGDDPAPDLQVEDPASAAPALNRTLAMIYGPRDDIDHTYRDHQLDHVNGPSAVGTIDAWFDGAGAKVPGGDRVLIYFTGHGGRAEGKDARNTNIALWNDTSLKMKDFTQRLDKLQPQTPVVLVMVQCFSGGFADVIFKGGDPEQGLSDHNRCGFFATVHDRPAAGCTPDIDEAEYQDYSTHFFAALHGQTRTGAKVEPPDFNGDGRIDFTEAHAYTLITSDSIDISIRTSDVLLRRYSTTEAKLGERTIESPLTAASDYGVLHAAAGACERAILDGLSERLGLAGEDRTRQIDEQIKQAEKERGDVKAERGKLEGEFRKLSRELGKDLRRRHPELGNPWRPEVQAMLADAAASQRMLTEIEAHPTYRRLEELDAKLTELGERDDAIEHRWVKLRRFRWVAETVALAANLEQAADPAIVDRYRKLIAAEHATLVEPTSAPDAAPRQESP